jgi:hypothetical protein
VIQGVLPGGQVTLAVCGRSLVVVGVEQDHGVPGLLWTLSCPTLIPSSLLQN